MAVRQDRGHWVVEFQQGGKRIFRRLPAGVTKGQAQALETKLRRELFDRDALGLKEDLTLEGAIGLWLQGNHRKNQKQAVSEARQWEPYLKGRLLKEAPEVAAEAVRDWTRFRSIGGTAHDTTITSLSRHARNAAAKSSTINRRLCILKAAAKHAWRQGLIQENVSGRITMLPERNKREIYLTRAQVMTLASKAPSPECRSAILIAAYTGLRASEVLALPAVGRQSATLTVWANKSKTGKSRTVPVPSPARPLLSTLPLSLSYWQLHKQFLAASKAAGMKHVHFHDLRHTAASWLINEGVDLYTVGAILGHSSTQTTARYAHLATKTLQKAMARLK